MVTIINMKFVNNGSFITSMVVTAVGRVVTINGFFVLVGLLK
jgi:hypothetical protein